MNFSLTWTSAIVFFITFVLKGNGIDADPESVTAFATMLLQVVAAIGVLWGRYRQGDINIFGKKVASKV